MKMHIRTKNEYEMALLELDNIKKARASVTTQLRNLDLWIRETEEQLARYEITTETSWHDGAHLEVFRRGIGEGEFSE